MQDGVRAAWAAVPVIRRPKMSCFCARGEEHWGRGGEARGRAEGAKVPRWGRDGGGGAQAGKRY